MNNRRSAKKNSRVDRDGVLLSTRTNPWSGVVFGLLFGLAFSNFVFWGNPWLGFALLATGVLCVVRAVRVTVTQEKRDAKQR